MAIAVGLGDELLNLTTVEPTALNALREQPG